MESNIVGPSFRYGGTESEDDTVYTYKIMNTFDVSPEIYKPEGTFNIMSDYLSTLKIIYPDGYSFAQSITDLKELVDLSLQNLEEKHKVKVECDFKMII